MTAKRNYRLNLVTLVMNQTECSQTILPMCEMQDVQNKEGRLVWQTHFFAEKQQQQQTARPRQLN
jgi:hypothetical protein